MPSSPARLHAQNPRSILRLVPGVGTTLFQRRLLKRLRKAGGIATMLDNARQAHTRPRHSYAALLAHDAAAKCCYWHQACIQQSASALQ